ncbi:MAG: tRNA preQ1(34) S-adenosylmethionine ribosyltransferase-isomerase QueA [Elusimicrobia bacterium]|nr:tRNA preQ1(34) S-adenosylmethionine ribosyltransferase-isomerase QueA [Elusimicrobiota bacterium]
MNTSEFAYPFPPELIAQEPVEPRDAARLLVCERAPHRWVHSRVRELGHFLRSGDCLVINTTKVLPARVMAKKPTGGRVEVLLLGEMRPGRWEALIYGGKVRPGGALLFPDDIQTQVVERRLTGSWLLACQNGELRTLIERYGQPPLPPYIDRTSVRERTINDRERYQTVYAQEPGSVAAPTAGFHLTETLLRRLEIQGIQVVKILLHVGWGTFRPLRAAALQEHQMLPERYRVSAEAAQALNIARRRGGRVVAVGTSVVRALETVADAEGTIQQGEGESQLFITPGYRFRVVDALMTNFHTPRSTPLLLACAFLCPSGDSWQEGRDRLFALYRDAIAYRYRFFSYGDAMLLL